MAAASTNQWAAVGDAVNSAALVETGFNIVRSSLPLIGVVGATTVYRRGAGGYCTRLNELETIIQSWDEVLSNLSPATIAQIEANIGRGAVESLRSRLSAIRVLFGRLKATHVTASFWDKVSPWNTPLSTEYANVQQLVHSANAYLKASTDGATRDLFLSMADEAHQAQYQSAQGATPTTSYRPPPSAHVHAGLGGPSMLPPPGMMPYHTGSARPPVPADAASNIFDQLVRFTVAYITPFARRRARNQRGNQLAPLPRGYNRV